MLGMNSFKSVWNREEKSSLFSLHFSVILFGFAGLFARWLPLPPEWIVLGRTFFAALVLPVLIRFFGASFAFPKPREWAGFLFSGALLALHWVAFFRSIQLTSVSVGLLAYSSFPVFVIIIEPLVFKESFKKGSLLFILPAVAGIWLISPPASAGSSWAFAGVLWGILSGLTFAGLILINRFFSYRYGSLQIAFLQDLFAFLFLLPMAAIRPVTLSTRDALFLAVLGVICTAVAHSLFIHSLKRIRGGRAGLIALAEPVYAILLAMALLGEIPGLREVAGGMLILGVAFWVTWKVE